MTHPFSSGAGGPTQGIPVGFCGYTIPSTRRHLDTTVQQTVQGSNWKQQLQAQAGWERHVAQCHLRGAMEYTDEALANCKDLRFFADTHHH